VNFKSSGKFIKSGFSIYGKLLRGDPELRCLALARSNRLGSLRNDVPRTETIFHKFAVKQREAKSVKFRLNTSNTVHWHSSLSERTLVICQLEYKNTVSKQYRDSCICYELETHGPKHAIGGLKHCPADGMTAVQKDVPPIMR